MYNQNNDLIVREYNNTLVISENQNGVIVTLMRITVGVITQIELAYYEANLKGRIKQIEADLILKYFYGLE